MENNRWTVRQVKHVTPVSPRIRALQFFVVGAAYPEILIGRFFLIAFMLASRIERFRNATTRTVSEPRLDSSTLFEQDVFIRGDSAKCRVCSLDRDTAGRARAWTRWIRQITLQVDNLGPERGLACISLTSINRHVYFFFEFGTDCKWFHGLVKSLILNLCYC